ncbi:MAG: cell division protein ZapA [Ruminococcus sp.]|nr:cell division protein ZapA [Ruminococcus sp.]
MTNKVKVSVCGKEFTLQTSQSPSYVTGLARNLETRIMEITASSTSATQFTAAIMVALTMMDDINAVSQQLEQLRTQSKVYVDEAGKTRLERDAVMAENQLLRDRLSALEKQISQNKAGIV